MKKILFTLQIVTLALAFPVWFIAEMKHADKAMQNNRINNADSAGIEKNAVQPGTANLSLVEMVTIPDTVQLLVNN